VGMNLGRNFVMQGRNQGRLRRPSKVILSTIYIYVS